MEAGHLGRSEQNTENVEEDVGMGQHLVTTPQEYGSVSRADFSDLMDKIARQGVRITHRGPGR